MIQIKRPEECCGCTACAEKCPKRCISMQPDAEGFLYPVVDASLCIECGLCEKVCPVLHRYGAPEPASVRAYACCNRDEPVRMASSSGGVFSLLAGEVLDIDGDCGGFNLQWAWSSGYVAGKLGKGGEDA